MTISVVDVDKKIDLAKLAFNKHFWKTWKLVLTQFTDLFYSNM